jgi:hypothetical protein
MAVITILRGFKVHYSVLDDFLHANGMNETYGYPPVGSAYDKMAALLQSKMGKETNGARIIIPHRESYDQSTFAYVAYYWLHVFAQREINFEELPETTSVSFEALRKEVMSFSREERNDGTGKTGFFITVTSNRNWYPKELPMQNEVSSYLAAMIVLIANINISIFIIRVRRNADQNFSI